MDNADLSGRTALVTGAAQGIGRSIATKLANRGANLVLNDIDQDMLSKTISELRRTTSAVESIAADVTSISDVHSLVGSAVDCFGSVDVLVSNVGVLRSTRFLDIDEHEWDEIVAANLKASFLCSQAVVPHMQRSGWGRIINMSSTAGKSVSTIGGAHYTAAKAGVLGLTRHLASEVSSDGITVNAVCPGLIDTGMTRSTISADAADAYARSFPIPRLGRPDEVAELVAFLASDRAGYITGASLDINGGDLMI